MQRANQQLKNLKKHIALLMLGVFCFPLLLQPIHVLRHHTQTSHCTAADHEHSCTKKLEKNTGAAFHQNSHCAICEYEFYIYDIAQTSFVAPALPFINYIYDEYAVAQHYPNQCSQTPSRAPPTPKA